MITGIKRFLRHIIRLTGFEVNRIPNNDLFKKTDLLDLGRLKNHYPNNELLKFSDHKEISSQFLSKLAKGKYKLLDRNCILCGAGNYISIGKSDFGFEWSLCIECGFTQMRRQLDHDSLNEFYISGEYQSVCMGGIDDDVHFYLEKNVMSRLFVNIFDSLDVCLAEASIFEIGCGSGGILLALQELGATVSGFDLDPHKVAAAVKRGVENIQCQDALDEGVIIPACDYVILSNVLEHLYDPKAFLYKLALKLSNSKSKLIIDVPNVDSLSYYGRYTQDFFHISHQ